MQFEICGKLHRSVTLLIIATLSLCVQSTNESSPNHIAWADATKSCRLKWSVDRQKEMVTFDVTVKGKGWIGLGILGDDTRTLKGADLWIGWKDKQGNAHLKDCHGTKDARVISDEHNDLQLVGFKSSKRFTRLTLRRKLATSDKNDIDIKKGVRKVIFAWGANIPDSHRPCKQFLGNNTHIRFKRLMIVQRTKKIPQIPSDAKYFDVMHRKVRVPAQKTTYWCTKFRLSDVPDFKSPHHIIAIQPLIQKRKFHIVHHMVLHSCFAKPNETNAVFSKPCFRENMPASVHDCGMLGGIYAWGIGMSKIFRFPKNVGYPVGLNDSSQYFLLQAHFNNEQLQSDIIDSSGLRFYYTKPRKYDAGMITVGANINDNMIIPPGMDKWTVRGVCTKDCTQKMRPRKRIKLFATLPHAHATVTRIRTTLVRNGVEVNEIIDADNFNMNHQRFHMLEKEVEVKEGDEIFNYCTSRTLDRKYATVGGMGSSKEMCLNAMMYYPKIDVETCLSSEIVVQPVFTAKYARPVFANCAGGSRAEEDTSYWRFSNWTGVEWTKSMKDELHKFYNENHPRPLVLPECRGKSGVKYDLPPIYRPIIKQKLKKKGINSSLYKEKKEVWKDPGKN